MDFAQLIELDDAEPQQSSQSRPDTSSFLSTAISLKVLQPSVWGEDDSQAQLHTNLISLGLHIPKRYLIIAQQAGEENSEVFLRFSISLSKLSYRVSYMDDSAALVLETRAIVRHEVIYSDTAGSELERETERGMVHLNCTLSTKEMEKGTKLVVQARDNAGEENLHLVVQTMASILEEPKARSRAQNQGNATNTWSSSGHATLESTRNRNQDAALPNPFETPSKQSADLLGEVIPDIWEGLEQLDLKATTPSPTMPDLPLPDLAGAGSNESRGRGGPLPELAESAQPFAPAIRNSSEPSVSLPVTPTEDFVESHTSNSGPFYLPSTRAVSSIQPLPSAVLPPTRFPMGPAYVSTSSLQGQLGEQHLQSNWETTNVQWSTMRKRSKFADAKTNYISGPRPSGDARMHELTVDRTGELRGGQSAAVHERDKENQANQSSGSTEPPGSGRGAFRNLGGRRGGRGDPALDRERTERRANGREGRDRGRGFGRFTGRGRGDRRARGGTTSVEDQRRNSNIDSDWQRAESRAAL